MSPISSRNTVPRCATSSSPCFVAVAPVNEPFSWPKSSVSRNSREMPAQLRSTKASPARRPRSWIQRASTVLPVPVSPWMSSGLSVRRTASAFSRSSAMAPLLPRNGSTRRRPSVVCAPAMTCRRLRWCSMVRRMTTSSASSSTGFVKNCSAPSFTASTAVSIDAYAVRTISAAESLTARKSGIRSSAVPSGRRKSSTATSG